MKIKKKVTLTCILSLLLFSISPLLWGHGIKITLETKPPVVIVNAAYHGSKSLTGAKILITFVTGNFEFQTGNTDKNGNFCFYPHKPGKWSILIDDQIGHRGKKAITLSQEFFNIQPSSAKVKSESIIDSKKEKGKPKAPSKNEEKKNLPNDSEKSPLDKGLPATASKSDFCCYALKIVLGALSILLVAYIFYWLRKRKEIVKE